MDDDNSENITTEFDNCILKSSQVLQYNDDHLGSLPKNWERAQTEQGEIYFIDHNTGSSHWLDPRLSKFQKRALEDCGDDELPFGWDVVYDPQYGMYYIDHVNRKTQYENPVIQAKRLAEKARSQTQNVYENDFTKDPSKLIGERIITRIIKSQKGFGFTIIGGDNSDFLQIKTILPNGPAWNDGKLKTGDVLVNVCGICVLGFSHHDMINIFQSILPDGYATIEVCRGYALPLEDPTNTEVITIVAVDGPNSTNEMNSNKVDYNVSEVIELQIFKEDSFGFTIADSNQGQKVKSILDNKSCRNICEGDILLTINDINVRRMNHSQVVEVLKDCPKCSETSIKVLRNKHFTNTRKFSEMTYSNKLDSMPSLYRSKTPTADIYSTETKTLLPIRSKTPLIDSRSRISNEFDIPDFNMDLKKINNFSINTFLENDLKESDSEVFSNEISNLANRYNQLDIENNIYERKTDITKPTKVYKNMISGNFNGSDLNSESIYSVNSNHYGHTLPSHLVDSDFAQENYFSYDNSDFLTLAPNMNDNTGNRLNQFMRDTKQRNFHDVQQQRGNNKWPLISSKHTNKQDAYIFKIMLERHSSGFGFRIVGGTEESSLITVGHIVPGGAADIDGRIKTGDEILSINETSLIQLSHHHVVQLMTNAADRGHALITLKRRVNYPYDVFVTRHENEGFGFVIISSSHAYGSIIGKLICGSPAEKCGELKIGDLIVAVNGISIINMNHGEVVNLIKESGLQVQLTIESPRENEQEFIEKENMNGSLNYFPIVC